MKQIIILSVCVISVFIAGLLLFDFKPPVPIDSSMVDYSKGWRLKGGIRLGDSLTGKTNKPVMNVVMLKDKKIPVVGVKTSDVDYEVIDLTKQYLKWSD